MSRLISEFGLTHQETADAVGRSRTAVTNLLRLLTLEDETKKLLDSGQLNMGHARALLALEGKTQRDTAHKVAQRGMSVRDTERLVKTILNKGEPANSKKEKGKPVEVTKLELSLAETLGADIDIKYNSRGKGKLVITYNSLDELDGILEHIK
jgi:ParB family chromosome partitioning protein